MCPTSTSDAGGSCSLHGTCRGSPPHCKGDFGCSFVCECDPGYAGAACEFVAQDAKVDHRRLEGNNVPGAHILPTGALDPLWTTLTQAIWPQLHRSVTSVRGFLSSVLLATQLDLAVWPMNASGTADIVRFAFLTLFASCLSSCFIHRCFLRFLGVSDVCQPSLVFLSFWAMSSYHGFPPRRGLAAPSHLMCSKLSRCFQHPSLKICDFPG